MIRLIQSLLLCITMIEFVACSKEPGASTTGPAKSGGAGGETRNAAQGPGHGGNIIELGAATIGGYTVRASRDEGEIKPGGDAPIDVWLTAGSGKVVAVRFWIGTEDAEGSVKAKADIENPAEPNHWHTHAELPDPLPPGSALWVELEIEGSGKQAGSFDLRM